MAALPHSIPCLLAAALTAHAVESARPNLVTSFLYPAGNLISNGSFENNYTGLEFEGWGESVGHAPDPAAFRPLPAADQVKPYGGRKMAAIRYTAPSTQIRFLATAPFPLKPDTWYSFSLRYRTADYAPASEPQKVRPIFQAFRSRDVLPESELREEEVLDPGHRNGAGYAPACDWSRYIHRFKTGPEANFGVISLLWSGHAGASGTFYFDDAFLTEGCVRFASSETLPSGCPAADAAVPFGHDLRHPDSIGVTRKFLDGNGRVLQKVVQDGDRDIVTQTSYDDQGRVRKAGLPIGDDFGDHRHDFLPDLDLENATAGRWANYYRPGPGKPILDDGVPGLVPPKPYPEAGGKPFAETRYEESPLGRVVEAAGPGPEWSAGSDHSTKTRYGSVSTLGHGDVMPVPADGLGEYFFKEVSGSDGRLTREFTDRSGRLVRSSANLSYNGGSRWLETEYEHDIAGNVVRITAPGESNRLVSNKAYDAMDRMVSEHRPETGLTEYKHDQDGRIRFTRTPAQVALGRFSFIRYDEIGRILMTGEVLGAQYFTPEKAELWEFPCPQGCVQPGAELGLDKIKFRTLNQYDFDRGALSCQSGMSQAAGPGNGVRYLALKGEEAVGWGLDFLNVYLMAKESMDGQSGEVRILGLYQPQGDLLTEPMGENEIELDLGALDFTFEYVSAQASEGAAAAARFEALKGRLAAGSGGASPNFQGRLVRTLSCNYELAEAMQEESPREVSTAYTYDSQGNMLSVSETNGYVEGGGLRTQTVWHAYDLQNRPVERKVCGDLECKPGVSHVERYAYSQSARLMRVLDRTGSVVVGNHFDRLGRRTTQSLGDALAPSGTTQGLLRNKDFHLHGWLKALSDRKIKDGSAFYEETLAYEDGFPQRFDGLITGAKFTLPSATSARKTLEHAYRYDNMDRLRVAFDITVDDPEPGVLPYSDKTTAYEYLDDGRLLQVERDGNTGDYAYDANGRIKSVTGPLAPGRNLETLPGGISKLKFDGNGNLIEDHSKVVGGHVLNIHYRADNLPYLIVHGVPGTGAQHKIFLAYDGEGKRVSKRVFVAGTRQSSKSYFGAGVEVREKAGAGAVVFHALAGEGRVRYGRVNLAGQIEYFLRNHLGTTQVAYDLVSGKASYAAQYDPHGSPFNEFHTGSEPITEKFTGKELDEGSSLYYFGARYFDPDLALWISPDAARQFHSPYSYGDPINAVDPDGLAKYQVAVFMWDFKMDETHEVRYVPENLQPGYGNIKARMEKAYGPDFEWKEIQSAQDLVDFVKSGGTTVILSHGNEMGFAVNPSVDKDILDPATYQQLQAATPIGSKTYLAACYAGYNLKNKEKGQDFSRLAGDSQKRDDISILLKQVEKFIDDQFKQDKSSPKPVP